MYPRGSMVYQQFTLTLTKNLKYDKRLLTKMDTLFKTAESVSLSNYCMWIFLCYKKLHMTKLSIRVKLVPYDKPFCEFLLLAFVRNTTFSVTFYSLYNSVTEEIRTAMSIKHQFMHFKWLKGQIPTAFIAYVLRNIHTI